MVESRASGDEWWTIHEELLQRLITDRLDQEKKRKTQSQNIFKEKLRHHHHHHREIINPTFLTWPAQVTILLFQQQVLDHLESDTNQGKSHPIYTFECLSIKNKVHDCFAVCSIHIQLFD